MLVKPITYPDLNGVEQTRNFYFNISKAEIQSLQFSMDGGIINHLKRIVMCKDENEMYNLVIELILNAYGEKSDDGQSFMKINDKGQNLGQLFKYHQAYEALIVELTSDDKKLQAFIDAITPSLSTEEKAQAEKLMAEEMGEDFYKVIDIDNRQKFAPTT